MLGSRNHDGLTDDQIRRCEDMWAYLCGDERKHPLDTSEAGHYGSRTRYDERRHVVMLGADAVSGTGSTANARMSVRACLAHELAHLLRAELGFRRPFTPPDVYLDEAETSIHASFLDHVSRQDREDLVEDAHDRISDWRAFPKE